MKQKEKKQQLKCQRSFLSKTKIKGKNKHVYMTSNFGLALRKYKQTMYKNMYKFGEFISKVIILQDSVMESTKTLKSLS